MSATPEDARESGGSQATSRQSGTLSLFDHDSSNFLLSPALSATPDSRPVSGILSLPSPPTTNFRDSVISIVDDPFFQSLRDVAARSERGDSDDETERWEWEEGCDQIGEAPGLDAGGRAGAGADVANTNYSRPRRRSHIRGESQTIGQFQAATDLPHWTPYAAMEPLNIAIIGARGVGKSSFVQRILGLPRPPAHDASSLRIVVDGRSYSVLLLELDLEHFDMAPERPIQWPRQVDGQILPRVDGALILYDVTNKETIMELPRTLDALTSSDLPTILVACKCDASENTRQVDTEGMANHNMFRACVANYNISSNKPEHSRACLNAIVRTVIAKRSDGDSVTSRRRAASVAQLDGPLDASSPPPGQLPATTKHLKHSRASSDLSLLRGLATTPASADQYRSRSPRVDYPATTATPTGAGTTFAGEPVDAGSQTVPSQLRRPGVRLDLDERDSFLDMDESDGEPGRAPDETPILQRDDDPPPPPPKPAGLSFDELVDRLVAPRTTRADHAFGDVFLCLYRKLAPPARLFSAVLERLDRVRDDRAAHYLTKTATQLRIIEVVAKWVSLYPGDFARPRTRRALADFVRHLSSEPIFFTSAQQIRFHLENYVVEDDDTWWATADDEDDPPPTPPAKDSGYGVGSLRLDDDGAGDMRGAAAFGSQSQIQMYEEYERQAARLEPSAQLPMSKPRYHTFMAIPPEDVAEEMTRMDWVMFSSIRIRDFVRHVGLSADERSRCRSLKNVDRTIAHFNHVAKWVANMILLRDKPKHRAQTLEKFMAVAARLRQMNNYNGLAAVLAGINGSAVHRLAQTRALVPAEAHKSFARLVILMGTQKSHFAYRLAWENSPLPRIPFIPLHRRDLISAEEGSRTLVGPGADRINWRKFEVLGEVLLPIMKSQGVAYGRLGGNDSARELVLDLKMPTDEEEIYQRSLQVEPPTGGPSVSAKKKFPWFANK